MNHNTRRSLNELFNCIERVKKAQNAYHGAENNADEDSIREKYLEFCRAIGSVEGQVKIVKIDLDIYEADEVKAIDPLYQQQA